MADKIYSGATVGQEGGYAPQAYDGAGWVPGHNPPMSPAPSYPDPSYNAPVYNTAPVYNSGPVYNNGPVYSDVKGQPVQPLYGAAIGGAPMPMGEATICGIRRKTFWIIFCIGLFLILAAALGLGLGLGLTLGKNSGGSSGGAERGGSNIDDSGGDDDPEVDVPSNPITPLPTPPPTTIIRVTSYETETTSTYDYTYTWTTTTDDDDYSYTTPTSTYSYTNGRYTTWTLPTGYITVSYELDYTLGTFCAPTGYVDSTSSRTDYFLIEESGSGYNGIISVGVDDTIFTASGEYLAETDTRWSEWTFDFTIPASITSRTCDFDTGLSVTFRKTGLVWLNLTNTASSDCVRSGETTLSEGAICWSDYSGTHDFAFKK